MSLIGTLIYLAPTIFGWIVRRSEPGIPLGKLFLVNVLLGWTVVGWIACFGYVVYRLTRVAGNRSVGELPVSYSAAPAPAPAWDPPRERRRCGACTAGQARCGLCGGQRGAHRDNVWVQCTYCLGTGTVQCTTCGGSGYSS